MDAGRLEVDIRMRNLPLLLLLLLPGCTSPTEPGDTDEVVVIAEPGLPFALKVGWRAMFPASGIEIEFAELVADSRCPGGEHIRCIWQGDGAVAVVISHAGGMRVDTLHTTLDPQAAPAGGMLLEFTGLLPHPEGDVPIPIDRYVATFVLKPESLVARRRRSD